jgi:hypothetical protein
VPDRRSNCDELVSGEVRLALTRRDAARRAALAQSPGAESRRCTRRGRPSHGASVLAARGPKVFRVKARSLALARCSAPCRPAASLEA